MRVKRDSHERERVENDLPGGAGGHIGLMPRVTGC